MRRLFLFALAVLPLAACNASRDAAFDSGRFDAREAAYIKTEGAGVIEGQAFLRDKSGQVNVRYAAGETVRLIPATAYARARIAHFYGGGKFVPAASIPAVKPDPEYAAYTRSTNAGPTGRFTFSHVAPGSYFVTTQLIWTQKGSLVSEGGAMVQDVTVTGREREPIEIVLSGN